MISAYCSAALALAISSLVLTLVVAIIKADCFAKRYFLADCTTAFRSANLVYSALRLVVSSCIRAFEAFLFTNALADLTAA